MKFDAPLVSIVIPVFNTEQYLEVCLESVINQTYSNIEIIVINDGSTDSSANICQSYAENDSRITFIDKDNEGVSITRNIGIDLACGEWIYFLDSDDFLDLTTFEKIVSKSNTSNADIIHFGNRTLKYGNILDEYSYVNDHFYTKIKLFLNENVSNAVPVSLTFIRHEVVRSNKIYFNDQMKHYEDILFVYFLYCHTSKILVLKDIFYNQVIREDSASRKEFSIKVLKDRLLFLENICKYAKKNMLIKEYQKTINNSLKGFFIDAAHYENFHLHENDLQESYSLIYLRNKDVFNSLFSKVANYDINLVVSIIKVKHFLREVIR